MAHTPGPWTFRALSGGDGLGYIEADGHDIIHAGVSDLGAPENIANARLIAAAPDLLEAAQDYMSQFGQALDCYGIPYGPAQVAADHALKAAIAKATGAA